ncbi:MAG TPA: diguanylate cyclase [Candidatus Limnocylindria bacterium]|nr:diguanylate cyclase [Candidatus Limnocylindria bacterium]
MLRLARAIGFLAPLAIALLLTVATAAESNVSGEQRTVQLILAALAGLSGATAMALLAWIYFGWRLNRLARALEDTIESDLPVHLRESGVPAERRLARAFNAAAGAFIQTEARATHDRLTGVANRETLLTTLVAEVERASRHHKWLSVAFIDIDRFKPINDTYGHNSGDAVLRQVALLIADSVRASDTFGRYGGEEFMLILPETAPDEAAVLAEKLRGQVMQQPMLIAGKQTVQVTISAGIAGEVGSQLQVDALVDQADAAMYAAKSLGRNRIYVYRHVDESAPVRRAPISPEHRAAATAIGRWASDTATEALASVLAPQPHHRGRPSDMIASLATGMALSLGLPSDEIERIRLASLLHDLGKLAVPSEILDKPTSLSDGEWQAIGEHPRIGQVILEHASALREAIPVVLHHHERYNGGGYPHGLKGNEIPLGARIVAVADAYHAMVHERPYKSARSHAEALAELRKDAGTQFDPDVVDLFCSVYADGVPPDGLEEVYRLHERARGGLERIDVHAAAKVLASTELTQTPRTSLTRQLEASARGAEVPRAQRAWRNGGGGGRRGRRMPVDEAGHEPREAAG